MANYLSRPYQVDQPVSQIGDINLAINLSNTLQTRYDQNKAFVDQTLAKYKALRGLRDSDNEYIASKINEIEKTLNGNISYQHQSQVSTITSAFEGVMKDPIIRDAVLSKAIKDRYDIEVSKIKEKDPLKYNDANYQYGLYKSGFQNYMNGKSNKLSNLSYTPYTNLNEETLKKLKTIKEVKGKRFIEEVSPDGKTIVRKELDGLTQKEVQDYINSTLTSQELQQIQINGWAKYNQSENSINNARTVYGDYHNQNIKLNEEALKEAELKKNNNNLGGEINKEYSRKYEELKYKVEALKKEDISKKSADEVAYELEKMGYVNGLTQIASTEWSTSIDVNDAYYKDKDLDIKLKELELKEKEYRLKEIKLEKELGVDNNGNNLADKNIAKSSKTTELEDLTEEEAGAKSLINEHNVAYNNIIGITKEFINNVPEEDKKSFLGYLKLRGINENLEFDNPEKAKTASITATIAKVFKEGGFASSYASYGKAISYNNEIKTQKAKDILNVEKEGYSKVFNQDPDKYINFLKTASKDLNPSYFIVSDVVGGKKQKELYGKIEAFSQIAGGWDNMKNYLKNNPAKLTEFAKLTDEADKTYKGLDPFIKTGLSSINPLTSALGYVNDRNVYNLNDKNLKSNAKAEIEKTIQEKTKSGLMTSVYSDFTFTNEKLKERVLGMIPNERTFIKGTNNYAIIDKKANTSFYKRGNDIILTQQTKTKTGEPAQITETILSPNDAGYQELLKYVEFDYNKEGIKINSNSSFESVKINMHSFENNEDTKIKKQKSVFDVVSESPNIQPIFGWVSSIVNPIAFATNLTTTDSAIGISEAILEKKGIPSDKIKQFNDKLFNNINSYKVKPVSTASLDATGYTLALDVVKGEDRILKTNLNVKSLDENTKYLIENHPQVLVISELLRQVTNKNIDNYINTF